MEAQEIVRALIESGMTQVQIAEMAKMPQGAISKIYRGEVRDVMSRNYRALQAVYEEVFRPPSTAIDSAAIQGAVNA